MFNRNFEIPNEIKNKTFVVGGAVRDALLGDTPEDFDFVVENTNPSTMKSLGFEEVGVTNFPVFLNEDGEEFALARKESKDGKGYKGFNFELGVDLVTDLKRRDLTVNAIAFDINRGQVVDPFDGRDAIENQELRHVSEAFADDPVRVLRLARFASRLPNFDVASETLELAETVAPELEHVPNERLGDEVRKTLKQAEKPRRFFDLAEQVGALEIVAPSLSRLTGVPAGTEDHHAESDTFEHTMMVLEEFQQLDPNNVRGLFACLAHDLGKGTTDPDVLPKHHGHGDRGANLVESFADNLRLSNELQGCMETGCRQHMRVARLLEMKDSKVVRLVKALDSGKSLNVDELLNLVRADALGREPSTIDMDMAGIEQRLRTAQSVVQNFDGGTVARNNPDKSGQQLGQLIEQRQIEQLRERM